MVSYFAFAATLAVPILFLFGMRAGIFTALVAHPIAAAAWYANYFIGPIKINTLVALSIILPTIVIARAVTRGPSVLQMPFAGIWICYLVYNILVAAIHAVDEGPASSLDLMFRHLAGFAGFYMLQAFFTERPAFKKILVALILSGIFPVGVVLYQIATGEGTLRSAAVGGDLRLDEAVGLTRYSGLFHDIVSVRGYAFQCLAGILLYWAYFLKPNRDMVKKALLIALAAGVLFALYKMYSKAAVGTLAAWFVIWCFGYRRLGLGLFIALALIGVNALQQDLIFAETGQLFSLEVTGLAEGASESERNRVLHGRLGNWIGTLKEFSEQSTLEQAFGYRSARGAHNDYLQKLLSGGVVGLLIYLVLLWKIGFRIAVLNLRQMTPINLMAAMVFSGWIIDTIGVVPSLYPGYQWYAWGLIGLALKGLDDTVVEKSTNLAPPMTTERVNYPKSAAKPPLGARRSLNR